MKYSESADYLDYLRAKADGDLVGALRALRRCVTIPEIQSSKKQHAHLLQLLGDVCFDKGDLAEALGMYQAAERIDPDSLLMQYYFAKFLAEKLKDKLAAVLKCDAIIKVATQNPFPATESDFGSEEYKKKAEELRRRCC